MHFTYLLNGPVGVVAVDVVDVLVVVLGDPVIGANAFFLFINK